MIALDVIRSSTNGKEWIIELNDTSVTLCPQHEEEDMEHIR